MTTRNKADMGRLMAVMDAHYALYMDRKTGRPDRIDDPVIARWFPLKASQVRQKGK